MGEYRALVDYFFTSHPSPPSCDLDVASLHPMIQKLAETDLFEKYLPREKESLVYHHHRHRASENTKNMLNRETILGEGFNEHFFFWKDDSSHAKSSTNKKKNDTIPAIVNVDAIPGPVITESQRTVKIEISSHVLTQTTAQPECKKENPTHETTIPLGTLHHCLLTGNVFKGCYYAFLMSHTMPRKKKDTNIGVSKNPIFSVMAHNNQAFVNSTTHTDKEYFPVIYDKDTAAAAPNWRLHMALGPFLKRGEAIDCCHRWVEFTRGTRSKCDKAPILARHYQCDLYSLQIPLNESLDSYLSKINAPLEYLNLTESVELEYHNVIQ